MKLTNVLLSGSLLCLAATLTIGTAVAEDGTKRADKVVKAAPDHETALLEGLKLIKAGDFDGWISNWCSTEKLCYTDTAKKGILRYNLPALKRIVGHCIKDGDTLKVTKTQGKVDEGKLKVFIECNPKGMPRPFHLTKDKAGWRFAKI